MENPSSELTPGELAFAEFLARRENGESLTIEDLGREQPGLAGELRELWADWQRFESLRARVAIESCAQRSDTPSASAQESDEQLLQRLRAPGRDGTRYQRRNEIARGGMGAIFEVWDEDLRRVLAMKVALSRGDTASKGVEAAGSGVDARTLGRFLEEAQITGQLDHPGIVPVHELGLALDGRVYFTMQLVRGVDLRRVFELVRVEKEGWNRTRALGVLLRVCEAMSYAHDKGVVHRDLKPANVMVGKYGEVYVMDWGLARVLGKEDKHDLRLARAARPSGDVVRTARHEQREGTPESPLVTKDGDVVGTPAYMPPEQAQGLLDRIGPRSDVYAVGAMLYELLTGAMPFSSGKSRPTAHAILVRLLEGPPAAIAELAPEVPGELTAICAKAMARDPGQRYADMRAFVDDLRAFLEGRVVRAHESGPWAEARKWVRRNRALSTSLAAALLLMVGVVFVQRRVRAEEARNARLEQQGLVDDLVERLVVLHGDRTLDARGRELDHAAHVARFLDEFRRARLPLDGDEEAGIVAARLESALGPARIQTVLDGLYTLAHSISRADRAKRAGPEDSDEVRSAPLWTRTLALIDALERSDWRKDTWKVWTPFLLSGGEPPNALLSPEELASRTEYELEWLAELLWEARRRGETRALYLRANELNPSLFQVHLRLGVLFAQEGEEKGEQDDEQDLHHYRVAIALRPKSSWAWFNLANACMRRGERLREEAIRGYRQAIELNPELDDAYANLALLLPSREGFELLREALPRVEPGDTFLVNLEYLALECGEPRACIEAARLGMRRFPSRARHPYHLGRGLNDSGVSGLEPAEAFTAAAELDPEMWLAWNNSAANFLEAAHRLPQDSEEVPALQQKALVSAQRAHELDPVRIDGVKNLAAALASNERLDEAFELLERSRAHHEFASMRGFLSAFRAALVEADLPELAARVDQLLADPADR